MAPALAGAAVLTLCYAFLSLSAVLCMDEAVEDECRILSNLSAGLILCIYQKSNSASLSATSA